MPDIAELGVVNGLWNAISHFSLLTGLLLVFGIPIIALIRFLVVGAIIEKPLSKSINWVLGIGWLIGIVLLVYWTFHYLPMLFSNPFWLVIVHWLQM